MKKIKISIAISVFLCLGAEGRIGSTLSQERKESLSGERILNPTLKNKYTQEELNWYRVGRLNAYKPVSKVHKQFKDNIDKIQFIELPFSKDKLFPYEDCIVRYRKTMPPPPEPWQIDVAKVICDSEKVKKPEKS